MTNNTNKVELVYLVFYSPDIEETRAFYESLGLQFEREKHGKGAEHYVCQLSNLVVEIYPGKPNQPLRLGLKVQNLDNILENVEKSVVVTLLNKTYSGYKATVKDPENVTVDLLEED